MSEDTKNQKNAPLTREQAKIRKQLITSSDGTYLVNYKLLLTIRREKDKLETDKHDFEGFLECTFTYHPKPDLKDPHLFLNFFGTIDQLTINSTTLDQFTFDNFRLTIPLDKLLPDKENTITILFKGEYNHSGVGLHHYTDPTDQKEYLYTQFEPYDCNRLFPCFDQPDLKAVLDLTVIAPDEWIVLSNENEIENLKSKATTEDNITSVYNKALSQKELDVVFNAHDIKNKEYTIHKFNPTPRISTYLYALCAGRYICIPCTLQSPVPLRLFMRETLKNCGEPEEIFKITIAGMEWYKEYFGLPYQFSKYDQIFCPEYNMGAMENVGLVTHNEYYCWKEEPTIRRRTGFAITILHELAHMWFGDLVTMSWWDDLWLNESFATFISHLCLDKAKGLEHYTTSWILFGDYKGYAYTKDQLSSTHPVMSDVYDTEVAETHFDEIVYEKGSSMLKQMYYFLGDDVFSKGLKAYFEKYKWSNTKFDDFIGEMSKAAGDKLTNLSELCDNWLKKAGLNEISLDMEIDEETQKIKKFIIKQQPCLKEHPNYQTHKVDILLIHDFKDKSKNIIKEGIIIKNEPETVLNDLLNETAPKAVFVNYNDWGYMKLDIDQRSINAMKEGLINMDDPLTKQLTYRSLFDKMRDSKISCLEFLEIVLPLTEVESNENLLSSLLRFIGGAIDNYMPLQYNKEYKKKYFDVLLNLLLKEFQQTPCNKGIVKQLLLHIHRACITDEDRNIFIDLLNPEPTLKGVKVDPALISQEERFTIVETLYQSKTISKEDKEKYLQTEIEKDKNSEASIQTKFTCQALLPDPKNKEEVWDKLVNKFSSESLKNMEALMAGFAPKDQEDLVKDYLRNKFFEVLPQLGKSCTTFYINSFINCCSPTWYVDEEIMKKYEELLEKVKDMSQVKEPISDNIDLLKRKIKTFKLCEEYYNAKK